MDKVQILNMLGPFVKGEVPKNRQWGKTLKQIAKQIPRGDTNDAISILESMFYNPFDPDSKPENDVPGAHGLYQELTARRVSFRTKEVK